MSQHEVTNEDKFRAALRVWVAQEPRESDLRTLGMDSDDLEADTLERDQMGKKLAEDVLVQLGMKDNAVL